MDDPDRILEKEQRYLAQMQGHREKVYAFGKVRGMEPIHRGRHAHASIAGIVDDRKLIIDVEMDHKGYWSLMPLDLDDDYPFDLFTVAVDPESKISSNKILFWRCKFYELENVIDLFLPACLEYLASLVPADFTGRSDPAVSPDVYPNVGGPRPDNPNTTS